MPGPATRTVRDVSAVGVEGIPETLAPAGTSAPMSRPLGPVPMHGEPAISIKLLRMVAGVIGPLTFTKDGLPVMLPGPGQIPPWIRLYVALRNDSAGSNSGKGVDWMIGSKSYAMLPSKCAPAPRGRPRHGSPKRMMPGGIGSPSPFRAVAFVVR